MAATIFIVLLFIGLPIALVLAVTAMSYIQLSGNSVLFLSYPQQFFGGLDNYGLLAIPLFMLVGELINEGGITKRLVAFASVFLGAVRGGLAYINIIANMMLASIVGSATAQVAVMAQVMVPEMHSKGYDRNFATATTAAGGLLGPVISDLASIVGSATAQVAVMAQVMVPEMHSKGYDRNFATATTAAGALLAPVIPPSMLFVIFGVLAQISIGDLFIAGIVPGVLMAGGFVAIIALLGFYYQYPASERLSRAEKLNNILRSLPSLSVPVVMIGSILGGVATPTEAAAVGAAMAVLVGRFAHGEMKFERMGGMLLRVGINSGVVLALVAAAAVFGWVIVYERIPQQLCGGLMTGEMSATSLI